MSPRTLSLITGLSVPAALTLALHLATGWPWPWLWLLCINLMLLGLMAKDKSASRTLGSRRTPESTLLILTLVGATPAMFLGRRLFRHKTSKESFITGLYTVCLVQAGLIGYFWSPLSDLFLGN